MYILDWIFFYSFDQFVILNTIIRQLLNYDRAVKIEKSYSFRGYVLEGIEN